MKISRIPSNNYQVKRLRRQRGVTLAEVLVATSFLGVCAASLVNSATQSDVMMAKVERRIVALQALKSALERQRTTARTTALTDQVQTTNVTLPGNRSVQIRIEIVTGAYPKTAKLTGYARWREFSGDRGYTDELSLETYVLNPEI